MTAQELNRDIKRLYNNYCKLRDQKNPDLETYFNLIRTEIKPEFERLYYADREFEYTNLQSMKIMLRMNVKFRFIPFHQFGLNIEIGI